MSASTVLSVIAPVAGAAPSPSATADGDMSAEFAAMVSDTGEGEAAPPSGAGVASVATVTAAGHMSRKSEPPKALSTVAMIEAAAEAMAETSPVSADAASVAMDTAPETPVRVETPEAETASEGDAEPSDADIVPLFSVPTPVNTARPTPAPGVASASAPVPIAANDAAPTPVVDEAVPADGAPEAAPARTETRTADPSTASPAPVALAEPVKPEPVRLAAAARDKAAGIDAEVPASSPDAPKTTVSPAAAPPATSPAANVASQAAAAPPPVEPAVTSRPETTTAAVEEASPVPNKAEAPTPVHTQVAASSLSRATVETTVQIAARIVHQLEGRQTRFDMVLTPEDLGRVEVSLDIDADGQLAARLAFDNPAAAADLRGRADELRRQLAEAGFQLSQDAFEFTERGAGSFTGGFERGQNRAFSFAGGKRLGDQADLAAAAPAAWINLSLTPDRVDMRV